MALLSRAQRSHRNAGTHRDRWMVSYVDVLTIVLMFFVGIAVESLRHPPVNATAALMNTTPAVTQPSTHAPAAESPAPAASPAEGPTVSTAAIEVPDERLKRVQQSLERPEIELHLEREGLIISLPQGILFASGKERVSQEALPILRNIAEVLRDMPNEIRIIGHADSTPIHNRRFKSNWDLATARSLGIEERLSKQFGISESRLSIASYGSNRPNSSNDTPDGRAKNRRVEILILNEVGADREQAGHPAGNQAAGNADNPDARPAEASDKP